MRVCARSSIAGATVDPWLDSENNGKGDAMSLPVLALGALVGWCGTRGPRPPGPKDPIIGMIVGIAAVVLLSLGLGYGAMPAAMEIVVLSIAAFAASRVVIDIVNLAFGPPVSH